MNYRHHFHAGNFADVLKHVVLLRLLAALQRKATGLLYLDTHAGRGSYELGPAAVGPDGQTRRPEWPEGIGRLWAATDLSAALTDYVELVRAHQPVQGGRPSELHFYPGSPWLAGARLRPQDRAVCCELRAEEAEALRRLPGGAARMRVEETDGYAALRALLPPPERRALVLIDPPFERADEFARVGEAGRELRRRLPAGTLAVWYPLTERARRAEFFAAVAAAGDTPALVVELRVVGADALVKMPGCGLLVLNPPWRLDEELRALVPELAALLGQDAGAAGRVTWLVPER